MNLENKIRGNLIMNRKILLILAGILTSAGLFEQTSPLV